MVDLTELKKVTEEILGEEQLIKLLELSSQGKLDVHHYIGFEISGKPHLGNGIETMIVIKALQAYGVKPRIFLADWHAWINDKLGGDKDFILHVGVPYFKEVMIAAAKCVGVDPENLEFPIGSTLASDSNYWATIVDVAKNTTLARVKRSVDIMGRKEGESLDFAKYIYPIMQVGDIFYMQNHIMHAGTDQRKAHVIAIDVALQMHINPFIVEGTKIKPVAIHHHLLLGLLPPTKEALSAKEMTYEMWSDMKMSKSKPQSAVFITDNEEEVKQKIMQAYCPAGEVRLNPVLDWAKYLSFNLGPKTIQINRKEEWGGDKVYTSYEELEKDFVSGALHPMDLKTGVADSINAILAPAREHLAAENIQKMSEEIAAKTTR